MVPTLHANREPQSRHCVCVFPSECLVRVVDYPCAPNGPGEMCGGMHSDLCCGTVSLSKEGVRVRFDVGAAVRWDGRSCSASVGMYTAITIVRCLLLRKKSQGGVEMEVGSLECDFSLCLQPAILLVVQK